MSTAGHIPKSIDIDCQGTLPVSLSFTCNGRQLVSCERQPDSTGGRLQRYQVCENPNENIELLQDTINDVYSAVVSKDDRWIVSIIGKKVVVRNTATEEVIEVDEHTLAVHAIDVSPDSTKFASGSEDKTVRIFSITTGKKFLGPLQHDKIVFGVKFSPDGRYLATVTLGSCAWVWDACTGDELTRTGVNSACIIPTHCYTPLGWSSNSRRVFVVSSRGLHTINVSWSDDMGIWYTWEPVPADNNSTFCSLLTNKRFIVCAIGGFLSFWDASTGVKIGSTITLQDSILSIALSSDDSYLACGRSDKKITIYALRDLLPLHAILDPSSRLPLMNVTDAVFKSWIKQELRETLRLVYSRNTSSSYPEYHALANRALIQTCSPVRNWPSAIQDANKSLAIQPSIIGHIAKAVALVGQGQQELAFEAFDACFDDRSTNEIRFLQLIKAILLFISGKRDHAITRVKNLIAVADNSEKYDYLQVLANMYLLKGDSEQAAMQSFERAQSLSFFRRGFHLVTILLIFGRSFEELEVTVHRPLR